MTRDKGLLFTGGQELPQEAKQSGLSVRRRIARNEMIDSLGVAYICTYVQLEGEWSWWHVVSCVDGDTL